MRIKPNFEELYIKGGKSGSETVTLTSSNPIFVSVDEYTKNLKGSVDYVIEGEGTSNVSINFTYSNLYVNGETYSANINAYSVSDVLNIPVIINCSDTLIYTNIPNNIIDDIYNDITITYSSLPEVNDVVITYNNGVKKSVINSVSSGELTLSKEDLQNISYITASNGLSQITISVSNNTLPPKKYFKGVFVYADISNRSDIHIAVKSIGKGTVENTNTIVKSHTIKAIDLSTGENIPISEKTIEYPYYQNGKWYYDHFTTYATISDEYAKKPIEVTFENVDWKDEPLSYLFYRTDLKEIRSLDVDWRYVNNLDYTFASDVLVNIPLIDCSNVTSAEGILYEAYRLVDLGGFYNIKVDIDLSASNNTAGEELLTHNSLMNVINNLAKVDNNPKLILGEANLSKLSESEIYIAIRKGWNVVGWTSEPNFFAFEGTALSNGKKFCTIKGKDLPYDINESTKYDIVQYKVVNTDTQKVIERGQSDVYLGFEPVYNGGGELNFAVYVDKPPTSRAELQDECTISFDACNGIKSISNNNVLSQGGAVYRSSSLEYISNIPVGDKEWSCWGMFYGCSKLTTIPQFDTSKVKDMSNMFKDCTSLITIPLLDTSKVTSAWGMDSMFYNCSSLTTIPLLDTSNVVSMGYMFYNCSSLTTIPLLDTSNVTNMNYMFYNCSSLTTIPLLDTSNVTNMNYMFDGCTSLTSIPLLDTSNVASMYYMFQDCTSLTSIPHFDTSNVVSMRFMFRSCTSLTSIPHFDTSKVFDMGFMFKDCTSLTTIPLLDTSDVTYAKDAFYNCQQLTHLGGFVGLRCGIDLSYSPLLTYESLMNVINNLGIPYNGSKTMTFSDVSLAKLNESDIKIATDKGWIIESAYH